MFYIVGLGNPGEKYENTRHNIGWLALDFVRQNASLPALIEDKNVSGRITEGQIAGEAVKLLYPDTYMNNSGSAVIKLVPKNEIEKLIVIHDDVDLAFGEIKLGKGKGAGGNNGVESIINKLGSKEFIRIRVGIAPKSFWGGKVRRPAGGGPLERFVLKPFTKKEKDELEAIKKHVNDALELILKEGIEKAMNQYN